MSAFSEVLRFRRLGRMILFAAAFTACGMSVNRYNLETFLVVKNETNSVHVTEGNETRTDKAVEETIAARAPVTEPVVEAVADNKTETTAYPAPQPNAESVPVPKAEPEPGPASKAVPESEPTVEREPEQAYEACFVTCVFAASIEQCDRPVNVTHLQEKNPTFKYFAFTNLDDLEAPGWTKILQKSLPYKRFITHSRWGKFMSWKHPTIQKCKVVYYQDGYYSPLASGDSFRAESKRVLESDVGLAQNKHDRDGPLAEFAAIRKLRKDIPSNIDASIAWLKAQPDFSANLTMYLNTFIGEYCKQRQLEHLRRLFSFITS